jgi:hypothetical protein
VNDDDLDAPSGDELLDGIDYLALQVRKVADSIEHVASALGDIARAIASRP